MKILITENQLKTIVVPYFSNKENELLAFNENWSKLNKNQKKLVVELYKLLHPNNSKNINEGVLDWVQTGMDWVGIVDPTGLVDLTNSVIYFARGDMFFGMLSLMSVIPIAGDAIAKPIIMGGKALGKEFKTFSNVVKIGDASKIAKSAKEMKNTSKLGSKIFEFVESFGKGMGNSIRSLLQKGKKVPLVGKFFELIERWIKVFEQAAKEIKVPTKIVGKGLSSTEKVVWGDTIKQMFKPFGKKYGTSAFRNLAKTGKLPYDSISSFYKNAMRVPETRKLFGKTKLFLRFLDRLGLGNYVGPDELIQKVPNAEEKFNEYMKTPEGQSAFNEEITPYIGDSSEVEKSKNGFFNFSPETQNVLSQFLKEI